MEPMPGLHGIERKGLVWASVVRALEGSWLKGVDFIMTLEPVAHVACRPLLGLVSLSPLARERPLCPLQWAEDCVCAGKFASPPRSGWAACLGHSVLFLPLKPQLPSHPPAPRAPLPHPASESAWLGHHLALSRSPGQGHLVFPTSEGLCFVHVTLADAHHSTWPPKLAWFQCMAFWHGWGVGSSGRPRSPLGRGADLLGISKWEDNGPVPSCPPGA